MDLRKLYNQEILDFMKINNRQIPHPYDIRSFDGIKDKIFNDLFNELVSKNANTFTFPVIDLYIATQLKPRSSQKYTRDSILKADPSTIQEFAQIMNLPIDNNTRSRILRILDYMELIFPINFVKLFGCLEESKIYYEILTDKPVNEEFTTDKLYRHSIDGFDEYETNSFAIHREENKQYLVISLRVCDNVWSSKFERKAATPENMKAAFVEYPEIISSEGKLIIPQSFKDDVYLEDPDDDVIDESVIFKFDRVNTPDQRLLEYITFEFQK